MSFNKVDLTQELGATELQARKIFNDIESRKAATTSTPSAIGYVAPIPQQPVVTSQMVTPGPVVVTQGQHHYQYYQRE